MVRRILVALLFASIIGPYVNMSEAHASFGLPVICASKNVHSVYWKGNCWTADEVWYPYFAKVGTWNFLGVRAGQQLAHRRVSLWAKPPGKAWRWLAAKELDSDGRAKAAWKAPSSISREWRFQWRSSYRNYESPKLKVYVVKSCTGTPSSCEY